MCTYFKTEIEKGFAEFKCPNCRKDWQYFCIRHVLSAKYGNRELQAFDLRMEEIYLTKKPGVQQCPFCHFHCEWQSHSNRVQCVVCTKKNGKPTEVPNVPSVRACDKCGSLINHKEACKHMKCRCGYEFCFICLGKLDEKTGMWPCGLFSTSCQVAPRQTTVTRDTEKLVEHTWGGEYGQNACRLMYYKNMLQ